MLWTNIWNMITTYYWVSPTWRALTIIAMIYLVLRMDKPARKKLCFIALFSVLIVLNDVSYGVLVHIFNAASYYRFLWVVPYGMVVAYAWMRMLMDFSEQHSDEQLAKQKRLSFIFAFCGIILVFLYTTQGNYFARFNNDRPHNIEMVYDDVLETKEIMDRERESGNAGEIPVIAGPHSIMLQYQTLDAGCLMVTDRVVYLQIRTYGQDVSQKSKKYQDKYLLSTICEDGAKPDVKQVKKAMKRRKVDYMIVRAGMDMEDYMESLGCSPVGQTTSFLVYRVDREVEH